jgi:uncharacterized membrane protein
VEPQQALGNFQAELIILLVVAVEAFLIRVLQELTLQVVLVAVVLAEILIQVLLMVERLELLIQAVAAAEIVTKPKRLVVVQVLLLYDTRSKERSI